MSWVKELKQLETLTSLGIWFKLHQQQKTKDILASLTIWRHTRYFLAENIAFA